VGKDEQPTRSLRSRAFPQPIPHPHFGAELETNPGTTERSGDGGIPEGGYDAVKADIALAMVDSQDFFPADFAPPIGPSYGGLFIRLAWHCNGSYRRSDGRGGCDGGRIRFDPEMSWPDNANLNQALKVLQPIKDKYGSSLSWGDLIVLAGTTAIEEMGGPKMGFCGGRIDDPDGSQSLLLGPSKEQEELSPCLSIGMQGKCQSPLGPTVMGDIYVDPEGPIDAKGDALASGEDIRDVFARMGFDDRTTVALIGGGHTFGKAHGACLNPPCGEGSDQGIGQNTFTSGFEGSWTTNPTTWDNQFFNNLYTYDWHQVTGPGGKLQWEPATGPDIMMLTIDLALMEDPIYGPTSMEYAQNQTALDNDFASSWYQLMHGDMGPPTRCLGDDALPPQPWQQTLPPPPVELPNYAPIRAKVQDMINSDPSKISAFTQLALGCANTFRETDYRGGCNGARVRFSPEINWPYNSGAEATLDVLEDVKMTYPEVSYSDLIVLAGQTAIESAGGNAVSFCGGRVDADNADGSDILAPRTYATPYITVRDDMQVKGLSYREGVALGAAPKNGTNTLSNQFFVDLKAGNGNFTDNEKALLEGEFAPIVDLYIRDNGLFLSEFATG